MFIFAGVIASMAAAAAEESAFQELLAETPADQRGSLLAMRERQRAAARERAERAEAQRQVEQARESDAITIAVAVLFGVACF